MHPLMRAAARTIEYLRENWTPGVYALEDTDPEPGLLRAVMYSPIRKRLPVAVITATGSSVTMAIYRPVVDGPEDDSDRFGPIARLYLESPDIEGWVVEGWVTTQDLIGECPEDEARVLIPEEKYILGEFLRALSSEIGQDAIPDEVLRGLANIHASPLVSGCEAYPETKVPGIIEQIYPEEVKILRAADHAAAPPVR